MWYRRVPTGLRDKAKVEVGVQVVERWIIAALRHRKFFRLEEVNRAVRELLERLNQRFFRKRARDRVTAQPDALERRAPSGGRCSPNGSDMSQWSRARVNIDYHIAFEGIFYSAPYTLVQEPVESAPRWPPWRFFNKGSAWLRILRSRTRGQAITENEHRPNSLPSASGSGRPRAW